VDPSVLRYNGHSGIDSRIKEQLYLLFDQYQNNHKPSVVLLLDYEERRQEESMKTTG